MSDIITRLLLKTNDFDANLNKSKQSVNSFQSDVSSMASRAGTSVMKFAGGIGIAVGGVEAFKKTIYSTQTTGDEFTKRMDICKASVDSFFTSIAMGNFDGFLSNLSNVINKAGDLSVILDDLATKEIFSNAELNNLMTQKRIQENIAKDKTKSDEERNASLEKARSIQKDINVLQGSLAKEQENAAVKMLETAVAKQGFRGEVPRDMWYYILKESNREESTRRAENYRAKRSENREVDYSNRGQIMGTKEGKEFLEYRKTPEGQIDEFMHSFWQLKDDKDSDLLKAIELMKKANSMYGAISDAELQLSNTDARINGSHNKNDSDPKPIQETLEWYDAEIRKKTKELSQATTMQAKIAAQTAINELQEKKVQLKFVIDKGAFENKYDTTAVNLDEYRKEFEAATKEVDEAIAKETFNLSKAATDEAKQSIQATIKELENRKIMLKISFEDVQRVHNRKEQLEVPIKPVLPKSVMNGSLDEKTGALKDIKLPDVETPIKKEDVNLTEEYAQSLSSVGSIMANLSGIFDNNTAATLQWGSTLLTTIAQAIPAIEALTAVKSVSTVTTQAETNAEVQNAGAKAMSAHAGIPFVGVALGLAAITGIIAAMASIPKFESGGIVPGHSLSGDNILARVNSGEMILNTSQQGALFRLLNSGIVPGHSFAGISEYIGANVSQNVIAPLSKLSRAISPDESIDPIQVTGDFRVRGSDIYLALSNYKKRTGKIR